MEVVDADRLTLAELLELGVAAGAVWQPMPELGVPRGVAVALLVVAALVLTAAIREAVAETEDTALQVIQAVAGGAAVATLVAAAVQIWRRARWWPWIAAHLALVAVAAVAALLA